MVSVLGDLIFNTTLILWISTILARGQSWAPLAVSGSSIAATLPVLLFGSLAGVFADRWNKRRTMVMMDALRTILILLLLLSLPFHLLTTWQLASIYLVVCGLNICSQFFTPSSLVLFGDIVSDDQWEKAAGVFQLITPLAAIIAPPIATFLFFTTGLTWALVFDALSFVVSLVTLLSLALPQLSTPSSQEQPSEEQPHLFKELAEGFRFYLSNSTLVTLLIVSVLIVAFDSIFGALGIFFVIQNLHTSAEFYGFISSAAGLGPSWGLFFPV
jgi:MFS family permease